MAKRGDVTPTVPQRIRAAANTTSTRVQKRALPHTQQQVKKVILRAESQTKKVPVISRVRKSSSGVSIKQKVPASLCKTLTVKTADTRSGVSVPILRDRLQLALLSPFRFPVDGQRLASQVARYSGVAFVVLGALLTFLNIQHIEPQSLAKSGAGQVALLFSQPIDCSTVTVTSINYESCTGIETEPPATISVESSYGTTLYGVVPISITVPEATIVSLLARNMETNQLHILGSAVKISDTIWRYYLDVNKYSVGEYHIIATIDNIYGSYSSKSLVVYNFVKTAPSSGTSASAELSTSESGSATNDISTTSQSTSLTGSASDTTTTSTYTIPQVSTSLGDSSSVSGSIVIRTDVDDAVSIKHYLRSSSDESTVFLGSANYYSEGEWRYTFDSTKYVNGLYSLKTFATFSNGSSTIKVFPFSIVNTSTYSTSVTAGTGASTTTSATTTTTSAAATSTSTTSTTATSTTQTEFVPAISILFPQGKTLTGSTDIFIHVIGATAVELYTIPSLSLSKKFIGSAQKVDSGTWRYTWDTKNTPNGSYSLFARFKHTYGESDSDKYSISVSNTIDIPQTEEQTTYVAQMATTTTVAAVPLVDSIDETETTEQFVAISTEIEDDTERENLETLILDFRNRLNSSLDQYARAVRSGDPELTRTTQEKIEELRQEILSTVPISKDRTDIIRRIDSYLTEVITAAKRITEHNEVLIKERVGDALQNDSDRDGVTDYDEINLYMSNPFSADSDADGFTDGAEILSGYDPNNKIAETYVMYESPKEIGTTREDLLEVTTITALDTDVNTELKAGRALISGKGLPNSFVTLYIYSTPIVVTVRTDTDGSWNYIFDKELEDGEHEVYVGITDNAGRIVAKSNPFAFVKVAQAFTPIDAQGQQTQVQNVEPSLVSGSVLLLVGSIAVVALGLVLILLGIHVNRLPQPILRAA